jgi:hypothetical protein
MYISLEVGRPILDMWGIAGQACSIFIYTHIHMSIGKMRSPAKPAGSHCIWSPCFGLCSGLDLCKLHESLCSCGMSTHTPRILHHSVG